MKKQHHFSDEGLVLTKRRLKDHHQRITIFSCNHGKLSLTGYGTKSLTSKRLSHLETGNVVNLSWRETGEYAALHETELQYAHSAIKDHSGRLDMMYLVFFVLNRLLPEKQPEPGVYERVLTFLKQLHKDGATAQDMDALLIDILMQLGFIDADQLHDGFDAIQFIEGLIGGKVRV